MVTAVAVATRGQTGLGEHMIVVDYVELCTLQSRMRTIHRDIEDNLTVLSKQVDSLRTRWLGAASDGFAATVRSWQQTAADLRDRLAELHNMVAVAHDNHAGAVHAGMHRWGGRTS